MAGAREIADLILLREELEDRFGPVPEPLDNLIKLQDARIKLGRAGARTVDFQGGRLAVAPIELDSTRGARRCARRSRRRCTSPGRSTVRVRVPEEAAERFPAVVAAAEAILEVATPARACRRTVEAALLPFPTAQGAWLALCLRSHPLSASFTNTSLDMLSDDSRLLRILAALALAGLGVAAVRRLR